MHASKLHLHEEILLLALQDEKGTIASGTWYSIALGGAILAELLLDGRISIESDGKKQYAKPVNNKTMGDDVLDEALEKIAIAKRRARLDTWVSRFSGIKRMTHRVANQLCKRGILRADEKQIMLFFTRRIYPQRNPLPEKEVIERLRSAIFTNTKNIAPRTIVLLSLANNCEILRVIFDRKRLREKKDRIASVVNGDLTGKATKEAVNAAAAALMLAAVMPGIYAATTCH